ncbi:hypothetical protein DWG18_01985 [Lysobacter sp. TY2-98]|nr:hypothetical protein DWG18_01985 [Lysobacter sp. TY2-98]
MLLVSALALPMTTFAAPTVSTTGGQTTVQLSPTFTGALASLGVAASASYPARLSGAVAALPIPTGEIDLGTVKGEIVHDGGLNLIAGARRVNISSFVIDTTGPSPVLTGLVKVDDTLLGRLNLFDLTPTSAPQVNRSAYAGKLRLSGVQAKLAADAAAALNSVFNVSAFAPGLPIGVASVDTSFIEPDR